MCDFMSFLASTKEGQVGEVFRFEPNLTSHEGTETINSIVSKADGLDPDAELRINGWAEVEITSDRIGTNGEYISIRTYEKDQPDLSRGEVAKGTGNLIRAAILTRWKSRAELLDEIRKHTGAIPALGESIPAYGLKDGVPMTQQEYFTKSDALRTAYGAATTNAELRKAWSPEQVAAYEAILAIVKNPAIVGKGVAASPDYTINQFVSLLNATVKDPISKKYNEDCAALQQALNNATYASKYEWVRRARNVGKRPEVAPLPLPGSKTAAAV